MGLHVVILAAGKGTRMKSDLPKVLHLVAGKTMLARVLEAARSLNPSHISVVVSDMVPLFDHTFGSPEDVTWVVQHERLGTGHAVLQAKEAVLASKADRIMVLSGDTPRLTGQTLQTFESRWTRSGSDAAMVSAKVPDPAGYGRILRDGGGQFRGIVEDRDAQPEQKVIDEINVGIYGAEAAPLLEALTMIGNDNDQGEYYLPDAFKVLLDLGARVDAFPLAPASEFEGVNTRVQLAAASAHVFRRNAERVMLAGATLIDPATTYIEDGVRIGIDTLVEPGVMLLGQTRLGSSCHVGAHSVLHDAVLHDGVHVEPMCHLDGAEVRDDCRVGPYARLRPGTLMEAGARVGNFVETKKAHLGEDAKASHLSYLGDCTVGAHSNIGAGTITCNYDGFSKHRTEIGEEVFVGSNSTLVAPLELKDRSFVAAGSTLTRTVPEDALAVGRARQSNKEGYARRLRERLEPDDGLSAPPRPGEGE